MPETYENLLDRAAEALDTSQFDRAEELALEALRIEPRSDEAKHLLGLARLEQENYTEAAPVLRDVVESVPDDPEARVDLGVCLFMTLQTAIAEEEFRRAVSLDRDLAEAHSWLGLCCERRRDYVGAEACFRRAHEIDPENPLPTRMSRGEFLRVVEEAVRSLPAEFRSCLQNVSIEVEDLPDDAVLTQDGDLLDPCLFGLFSGVPVTEKSFFDTPRMPDRIRLFQRNLERVCADLGELTDEITITLRHEIAHYLGHEEEDLEELGYA